MPWDSPAGGTELGTDIVTGHADFILYCPWVCWYMCPFIPECGSTRSHLPFLSLQCPQMWGGCCTSLEGCQAGALFLTVVHRLAASVSLRACWKDSWDLLRPNLPFTYSCRSLAHAADGKHQSMVLRVGVASLASSGTCWKFRVSGPTQTYKIRKSGVGPAVWILTGPLGASWCTLFLENQ